MAEKIIWDNGKIIATDWKFEEFGDIISPKLELMPKLDMVIHNYSQYWIKRYWTGCTIMSAINAFSTLNNVIFSAKDIESVYDLAETKWWTPWNGWSRSEWWITMKQRWDTKYPDDKASIFTISMFSDDFNTYLDKLGIIWVSINVDSAYWKDVRDNLILDSDWPFGLNGGHATCMMFNNKYFCVDSVSRNYTDKINEGMQYVWWDSSRLQKLRDWHNLRSDCHVIIMDRWLRETDTKEGERLLAMKKSIENAITANSEIRALTTSQQEKDLRHKQNEYNRTKVKLIEAMLS